MKQLITFWYFFLTSIVLSPMAKAQTWEYYLTLDTLKTEIGKPFPDFEMKKIENYKRNKAKLSDFKGKWLVLHKWPATCATSVKSLATSRTVLKKLGDRLELIMLASDRDLDRKTYKMFSDEYKTKPPVNFDTDVSLMLHSPWAPYYFIVDPEGILRAAIDDDLFTVENLEKLMDGRDVPVTRQYSTMDIDFKKPLLTNGNGGDDTDFIFRSMLSKWRLEQPAGGLWFLNERYGPTYQFVGFPLGKLYNIAYTDTLSPMSQLSNAPIKSSFGKYWQNPILEMNDSSLFQWDAYKEKNLFCYSLTTPKDTHYSTLELQQIMQRDLKNYFGYEVAVEERIMPCFFLRATDKARKKLLTKGGRMFYEDRASIGFRLQNAKVQDIITALWSRHQTDTLIMDDTGIEGNIDIDLVANMMDWGEVESQLKKIGLSLEKGEKMYKVIVIRDKKPVTNPARTQ